MILGDHQSDSDLSDVQEPPPARPSSSPEPEPVELTGELADGQDFAESEDSSDGNASDDADFDMEDDVPSPQSEPAADDAESSSRDSSRAAKRKAATNEDAYIKANPELYGLRRSVRRHVPLHSSNALTAQPGSGRPASTDRESIQDTASLTLWLIAIRLGRVRR
jgi:hypothetical protein